MGYAEPVLGIVQLMLNKDPSEILNCVEELSMLMDNAISYSRFASDTRVQDSAIKKYLISYDKTEEIDGVKELKTKNIETETNNILIAASDYLNSSFKLQTSGNSGVQQKILPLALKFKEIVAKGSEDYVFEDEFISIAKVLESLFLNYTTEESTALISAHYQNFVDYVFTSFTLLELDSVAVVYASNLVMHIFIREPTVFKYLGPDKITIFINRFFEVIDFSTRVHERSLTLMFLSKLFVLNNAEYLSNIKPETKEKLAKIFYEYAISYKNLLMTRYSAEEIPDYEDLSEDVCFMTCLDYIDFRMLMKDTVSNCSADSVGIDLFSHLTSEQKTKLQSEFF